ncbi:MAG: hypothetical protein ACHQWU_08970 [Gemmatimonadales bacterium]
MADEQRRDRDDEHRDWKPSDDRGARQSDDSGDHPPPDIPRGAPLTRREREERWPIG